MTSAKFNPTTTGEFVNWGSASIWLPAQAPNDDDTDVTIGQITNDGAPYNFFITVGVGDSFSVASIDFLANYLEIDGALSVAGDLDEGASAEIDMEGGTLTAGSLELQGYDLQGSGTVDVTGTLTVDTQIVGGGLVVDAQNLVLDGKLVGTQGALTVAAPSSGEISGGALVAGSYETLSYGGLDLNFGAAPTIDAADIELNGGDIEFYDPSADAYVPIQNTLKTIASDGKLEIGAGATDSSFGALTDNGTITLDDSTLSASSLTIGASGLVTGAGELSGPVTNDGVVTSTYLAAVAERSSSDTLVVDDPVSGTGYFLIEGTIVYYVESPSFVAGTLELKSADSDNVQFGSDIGTLQLDEPSTFTGSVVAGGPIARTGSFGTGPGFTIALEGVDDSTVTGDAYIRTGASSGTLTVDTTAGNYSLNFQGGFSIASFKLSAGEQGLSTQPPILDVTATPQLSASTLTSSDFNGDGLSDIFWRDIATGAAETWFTGASGGFTYADDGSPSLNWQVAGTGDFNGDGLADILWRNAQTDDTYLYLTNSVGGFTYEDLGTVGGGWQVAGIGDFNGDGLADILWQNSNGAVELWRTNPSGGFTYAGLGNASGWQVADVGDFNGDGLADILWRNASTGDAYTWLTKSSGGFAYVDDGAPSLDWRIAGNGDFGGASGGDGDILWRNTTTGDAYLYLSNGAGGFNYEDLGIAPADWRIAAIGNFSSNGLSDILWRNSSTGDDELWLTKTGGGFTYSNIGNVPTNWTIAS